MSLDAPHDALHPAKHALAGAVDVRQQRSAGKRWLGLMALLFALVFIVHLFALDLAGGQLGLDKPIQTTAFTTRMIEPPPAVPTTPAKAEPVVAKAVRTPPQVKPTPPASPPKPVHNTSALTNLANLANLANLTSEAPGPPVATAAPEPQTTEPAAEPATAQTEPPAAPPQPASGETGQPPQAFILPSSAKLLYTVNFTIKSVLNRGQAELTWQHDGDNYTLGLLAKWRIFSLFEQTSVGRLSPQGLLPNRFSDKRFRKSGLAAHFDHTQGKISFSANTPDAVLQAGAQDRVGILIQLAGLLAADPAKYPPNSTLSLQTVSAREAEPWLFTVNEPETLDLPAGPQTAVRLTRNPRREFDQKIELWFAPALDYGPVRFRFTESSGDYVDAQLQSSQSLPDVMPR